MNKATLVAELGINHNGSFDSLMEMASTFLYHGADYVKTQMRTPRLCVPESQWNKPKEWNGEIMTYIEYKELMEFNESQYDEFDRMYTGYWFPSVWDIESLERASVYDLPFIKIPSAMVTNLDLIREAARLFPIVISTGMSDWYQIEQAVEAARTYSSDLTLLQCTSTYPVRDDEVNLLAMKTLMEYYGPDHVGFSSHSSSPYPAIYSALLGAEFIEVHATLDRSLPGTDQGASLEPRGIALIARELERIPHLMGDGIIRIYQSEIEPMEKLRG